MEQSSTDATASSTTRLLLAIGLIATLILLLLHAGRYVFLTDDSYISFRYADNFARGYGLVFNAGMERVEGYTNFLWVVLLAGLDLFGISPPIGAHILSFGATVMMWLLVLWYVLRFSPPQNSSALWTVLVAPLLLATTRSVAVWSTGGLETRLYELLVLGGTLRILLEESRGLSIRPWSALIFALAVLTRPDGAIFAGAAFGVVCVWHVRDLRLAWRWILGWLALFGAIVGGHLIFRWVYYGRLLPNTYYAKVGDPWWKMGWVYISTFLLEYSAILWVPLLLLAAVGFWQRRTMVRLVTLCSIVVLHALYICRVGGDHFEFRPLDIYFPLLYLVCYEGARHFATTRLQSIGVAAYVGLICFTTFLASVGTHDWFPKDRYRTGVPGLVDSSSPEGRALSQDEAGPLLVMNQTYLKRLRVLTGHFVGIRQEEHRLFLEMVREQGLLLQDAIRRKVLPQDLYVATDCVGAIPYLSGLPTLDRLGLTDAHVAQQSSGNKVMAHDKRASLSYARQRGVEYWAYHEVKLLFPSSRDPLFVQLYANALDNHPDAVVAELSDGSMLLGEFPQGLEAIQKRLPGARFWRVGGPSAPDEANGSTP